MFGQIGYAFVYTSAPVIYSRDITIDHTQCGSSNTTDYACYVALSNSTLKTVANGGHVYRSDGYDIVFYSDAGHTTYYTWTIINYDGTTGALYAVVNVTTLSSSADTKIYMQYGSASITTFQGGSGGYNSHYKVVCVNPNSPTDISGNGLSLTAHGTTSGGAGKVYNCGTFNGSSDYVSASDASFPSGSSSRTVAIWAYPTAVGSGAYHGAMFYGTYSNNAMVETIISPTPQWFVSQYGAGVTYSTNPTANNWYYVVASNNGNSWSFYVNNNKTTGTMTTNTVLNQFDIGAENAGGGAFFTGNLNYAWVRNDQVSDDEITAHYNNENNPGNIGSSGFYSVGSEY